MTFEHPWLLLLVLPAWLIVGVVAKYGRRTVGPKQHRAASVVRVIGVGLLVAALAQPLLVSSSGQRSVLFVLDRSSSITAEARVAQEEFVATALSAAGQEDLMAVAVFGRELRMDSALSSEPPSTSIGSVIDPTTTDLAGALRAGAAVLPTEGSRRIVVLTDAVETTGDARAAARELADAGVAVDVITLTTGRSSDALIAGVDAPVTSREGDRIPVQVDVQATASGPAVVSLTAGDEVFEVAVDLVPGRNTVDFEVPASDSGVLRLAAEVEASFDAVPQNDQGEALVRVLGAARIAVVEGVIGDGAELARALEAGGMRPEVLSAIPAAEDLLVYDGVVLVNVVAPREDIAQDLADYVEALGRGLVVVGGDQAYGLGDYQETAFEEVLPVTSDPDDLIRRQPVAEVLVIDTSGSMANCHCDGIAEHDPSGAGGVNKTDISRAGAGLAIGALQAEDRVGVLAFTSGTRWALPLDKIPSGTEVAAALNTLTPQGDTEITPALREALAALIDAPEEIKHMILFTDGWGDDPELLTVAQDIADAGITLSVLGTGEGTGDTLRRMAALGGGRFYAGRDLEAVPEVFAEETLRVARPLVAEGQFLPALGSASPITAGLSATPALRGYVLTKAKQTAQIPLEIGPGDPLLATWQRGLGRATVWTSDATARWSADWLSWSGFVDFWGSVVRDTLPPGLDTPPSVRLEGGSLVVRFDTEAPLDASAIAHVRDAEGNLSSLPLQRSGENTFEGRVPVAASGAYWVAVEVENADGVLASGSNGIVAGYADEFAFRDPDPQLASDIASATGGRVEPEALDVFDPAPERGAAKRELWPLLVAIALALFLIDIGLRRLVVAKGDLQVWKETLKPSAKEPVTALETSVPDAPAAEPPREVHPEEETFGHLLRRKRK